MSSDLRPCEVHTLMLHNYGHNYTCQIINAISVGVHVRMYYSDIPFLYAAITIGFAQPTYSVQETIGTLDTLVFIQKEGGVLTEQVITVIVRCDVGSVMVLPDPPRPFLSRPAMNGM